ncbi:hypothetical protein MRBLMR1_001707 [Neorhizobium sp. LMR1-1-1.1]
MSDQPNIFQMYVANRNRTGFWIRRTTWGDTVAQVTSIGPLVGPAPYFGNPKVFANIYSLGGVPKEKGAKIPVPGTYKTWRQIEPPKWASKG